VHCGSFDKRPLKPFRNAAGKSPAAATAEDLQINYSKQFINATANVATPGMFRRPASELQRHGNLPTANDRTSGLRGGESGSSTRHAE